MREGWLLVLGLVFAGCFDDINADLNADVDIDGDGRPDEPVTVRPPAEEPGKVVADAEPEPADVEPDAGQDAGPLALFDTACTGHELCAELDPVGGVCWELHTEPGRFPHDMFGHCTFACGRFVEVSTGVLEWQDDPERVNACWAMDGTCEQIGQDAEHCVPAAD